MYMKTFLNRDLIQLKVYQHYILQQYYQANIYLLKVKNRNTRKKCEIYSKLTIKKPE